MKIYNECCNIYYGFSPLNRWAIKIFIIIALASVLCTLVGIVNGEEKKEEPKQETLFISCDNPAGCVGKFPRGTDWPVCPICNTTPIYSSVNVSKKGNIAEEIVSLFEETRSLHDEIQRIKDKRSFEEQERIKNLKAYNIAYAEKVRDNMRVLADAYARTKTFLEKGGEIPEIPDNKIKAGEPVWVITGFLRGKPVWKKVGDFPIYPRPK